MVSVSLPLSARLPERADVIIRARLDARFARALDHPVALVTGSLGSGKSIAAESYLTRSGIRFVRYRIESDGLTPLGFVRGLASALAPIAPGAFLSASIAYERAAQSSNPGLELAAWLREHTRNASVTIFVDDLGSAEEIRPIAKLLCPMIEETRRHIRWVLTARDSSALPVASWLAHGLCGLPIDTDDLRFTDDEARTIALARQSPLSSANVGALVELLEGWPLGVSFAIDTLRDTLEVLAVPAEPAAALRYFSEMVFATRTPSELAALLHASFLPDLDPHVLEALPLEGAAETVERLARELPTIVLASSPPRFQPAFARQLVEHRARNGPSWSAGAANLAALALEESGRAADAIAILQRLDDLPALARILEGHGLTLIDEGRSDIVDAAVARLETTPFAERPVLLAIRAMAESHVGHYDTAEAWFRMAIHHAEDAATRAAIAYRFALEGMRRNRPDSVESLAPILTASNAETPTPTELAMRATLATAYAVSGKSAEARSTIEAVLSALDARVPGAMAARILHQAAFISLYGSDFDRARRFAVQAIARALEAGAFDVVARANTVLKQIALDVHDDPLAALHYLEEFARYGLMAGNAQMRVFGLCSAYDIEVERGNLAQLDVLVSALHGPDVMQYHHAVNESLLPGEAARAAWDGDFAHAYRLASGAAEKQNDGHRRAVLFAEIAIYAAVDGMREESMRAIERSTTELAEIAPESRGGRAAPLCALAALLLGDVVRARTLLYEARLRGLERNRRTAAMAAAVESLIAYAFGEASIGEVRDALGALDGHELRGYRFLFEALPARRLVIDEPEA